MFEIFIWGGISSNIRSEILFYGDEIHQTKCDIINDTKLFTKVYGTIYCCKFLTLSNQVSHNKIKCIIIPG